MSQKTLCRSSFKREKQNDKFTTIIYIKRKSASGEQFNHYRRCIIAVLAVPPYLEFQDNDGTPLELGVVWTYAAGTTTPKATFTDYTGSTQLPNPVPLDAAGRATIWIEGAYKFVVRRADGTFVRETDNINSFLTLGGVPDSYFESFSGTGAQTVFTTAQDLGTDEKSVYIFLAGVYQQPTTYTVNGTTLTFAVAPPSASNNISVTLPSSFVGPAAAAAAAADASATAASNSAIAANADATQAALDAIQTAADRVQTGLDVTDAQTAATNAQNYAAAYSGTSTTSLAIGVGSKVFTTQASKLWVEGQYLQIASDADGANYMHGNVTTYSGTTLTMNITDIGGSGTLADWNISISGTRGSTGAAGGPLVDGDYGDVTVSGTGTVITIDALAVTAAKMSSGAATAGQVPIANGSGGVAYGDSVPADQSVTYAKILSSVFATTAEIFAGTASKLVNAAQLAAALLFKKEYISADTVYAASTVYSFTHGLGGAPKTVRTGLRCLTAEHGYAIGDVIEVCGLYYVSPSIYGVTTSSNTTTIYVSLAPTGVGAISRSSPGAGVVLTATNWRLFVQAYA